MIYTIGHKNPDSDSICAAISLAYLLDKIGKEATPLRQGELNPESQYILDKFNIKSPELLTATKGKDVYLVDHSDLAQAPDDIKEANILGIIDHHKLGDITTSAPLECNIKPIGCTNTIIKEMYDYHNVKIPKGIAGIMMSAILSDTVIFKSPTCTELDKKVVAQLSEICEIDDVVAYGIEMFKVKSQVEGTDVRELVLRDFKDFEMNGKKIGIGQLEVVDLSIFDSIKDELLKDIEKLKEEGNRDGVLLLLTDIMKEGSELLCAIDDEEIINKAFNVKLENKKAWLDGALSRKKQIVPPLQEVLNNIN